MSQQLSPQHQSLKRIDYEKSCLGKIKYDSKSHAAFVAKSMTHSELMDIKTVSIYYCRHGDHWHIGHSKKETLIKGGIKDMDQMISGMMHDLDEVLSE